MRAFVLGLALAALAACAAPPKPLDAWTTTVRGTNPLVEKR